jgi:predicted alpha/beta superfamily hydrolase
MRAIQVVVLTSLLLSSLFAAADDAAFQAMQSIRDTQHIKLASGLLKRDFHLLVKLPATYSDCATCEYPIVYLLDGGAIFPALAGYYNYLRHEEIVPEVIIVGISYGSDSFEGGNHRSTDFTAPSAERDFWGGAIIFQKVLMTEVFPQLEGRYRVDSEKRIIFGQSLAGQFVLFTALKEPGLFYGHISSNPALHRNLEFFLEERKFNGRTKLFVAKGNNDDPIFKNPSDQWVEHWSEMEDAPFEMQVMNLPGYGHFSVLTESFRHGLVWLFR